MVELDQMKIELGQYKAPLAEVKDALHLEDKKKRIEELDMDMASPDFWNDTDRANKLSRESKNLKDTVEECHAMEQAYDDIEVMIEMGNEENDQSMIEEVRRELDDLADRIEKVRLRTLLTGEYDANNAILSLNAGAGGTESCDWCGMLYRMYMRWAERKGFTF